MIAHLKRTVHRLKKAVLSLKLAAVAAAGLVLAPPADAATWNASYGIGNPQDQFRVSATGAPLGVIASVHSNAVYTITSAYASGQPLFNQIWTRSDLLAATLNFYVATNSYELTNSGAAGTNVLSLSTTNGLGSGDILVLQNVATDTYQMLVNSNNSAFALVTYNGITNGYRSGDRVYKMALRQSFTPASMNTVTNTQGILGVPVAQWMRFGSGDTPFQFAGTMGYPSLMTLTYSNAGGLHALVDYYAWPRR